MVLFHHVNIDVFKHSLSDNRFVRAMNRDKDKPTYQTEIVATENTGICPVTIGSYILSHYRITNFDLQVQVRKLRGYRRNGI
jgi:hypothetical protein